MFVLDTNVISELMRSEPEPRVMRWVSGHPAALLYVTSITQAEVLFGIRLLPAGRRRNRLDKAARETFEQDFAGRNLAFDDAAAIHYAEIGATRRRSGRPISAFDAQIAAICAAHGASVVTGNVADFEGCGIRVVDPWR